MLFEIQAIQREFMRHFGAKSLYDLLVPDGDYRVPVYDEYFNVRIKNGAIWLGPKDFDEEKAVTI